MASTLAPQPSFYGTGLSFPFRLDPTGGRPALSSGEARVREQMEQVLQTDISERPFVSKNGIPFGTRIRRIVFESVEDAVDVIIYESKRALDLWVPSIIVDSVDASEGAEPGLVIGVVFFRFRSTNRSDNFVTPYRLSRQE